MKKINLNIYSLLLGATLVIISCIGFYSFGNQKPILLKTMDHRIMDMMFKIRGPVADSGNVIIIDIDEKSLKALGQWPWPRNILADLTKHLFKNRVKVIGFDIIFPEKDRTSPILYFNNLESRLKKRIPKDLFSTLVNDQSLDYDILFGQSVSMGPSVLGYVFQMKEDSFKSDQDLPFPEAMIRTMPENTKFDTLSLIPAFRAVVNTPDVAMAQSEGFINVFTDDSGTTRQVPLMMIMDNIPYPSLALETFRVGTGIPGITIQASERIKHPKTAVLGIHMGKQFIPTDTYSQIFVNYRGPVHTFKYISAIDVLNKPSMPDLKDKFVLIGTSSIGLFDLRTTPFSSAIPGVEINANIIDNLIKSDPFNYDIFTEIGLTYTLIVGGGVILSLILSIFGPLAGGFGAALFFSGTLIFNYYYFFLNNQHVGMTYPLISCAAILLIASIYRAFRERKTKRYIQKAFSHYVSPDVVSHLIKNPKALSLKGTEKKLTILFCDIRGFTSISENMSSQDLGDFMNDFLTRMSQLIMAHNGTVDKFIGDSIMAFWGAPKKDLKHSVNAVRAALHMASDIKNLNILYKRKNLPEISVGIGINSGTVSVGNFGSKDRFDYTVMGDNVNLASRLEGANKNYGTTILISKTTQTMVHDFFFCRYIDKVQVKGKQKAVDIYEPLLEGSPSKTVLDEVNEFEKGVIAYQQQDFKSAYHIMTQLYDKTPHQLYQAYINRIKGFLKSSPQKHWDGSERRSFLSVNKLVTK